MPTENQRLKPLQEKAIEIGRLLAPFTGAEREAIFNRIPYCRCCGQPNSSGSECSQCFDPE